MPGEHERIYGDQFPITSYVTRKCSARADWIHATNTTVESNCEHSRSGELIARFLLESRAIHILERKEIKTARQLVDCIIDCYPERERNFFFLFGSQQRFLIIQRCAFRSGQPASRPGTVFRKSFHLEKVMISRCSARVAGFYFIIKLFGASRTSSRLFICATSQSRY